MTRPFDKPELNLVLLTDVSVLTRVYCTVEPRYTKTVNTKIPVNPNSISVPFKAFSIQMTLVNTKVEAAATILTE